MGQNIKRTSTKNALNLNPLDTSDSIVKDEGQQTEETNEESQNSGKYI